MVLFLSYIKQLLNRGKRKCINIRDISRLLYLLAFLCSDPYCAGEGCLNSFCLCDLRDVAILTCSTMKSELGSRSRTLKQKVKPIIPFVEH